MSFLLILLFIFYELLEAPPRGFVSMKIIDRQDDYGVYIKLSIRNNSSNEFEGVLLIMLGYNESVIYENETFYRFEGFRIFNSSVIQLLPEEEKILDVRIPYTTGVRRVVAIYSINRSLKNEDGDYDLIIVSKGEALWVQTWVG